MNMKIEMHGMDAAIEFSERLSYFGLATNLILYLTRELHQELKTAARNVNYWQGVTALMPLLGGFLADGYLGRFSTVLYSTLIYFVVCYINYLTLMLSLFLFLSIE